MQIFSIKSKQWLKVIELYLSAKFEPVEVNHFRSFSDFMQIRL